MSVEVNQELVAHLAHLARLALSDEERRELEAHFRKVLAFVEELQGLDLEGVDPSLFSLEASNIYREDEVAPSLGVERALANAPRRRDSFFVLPRIVLDAGAEGSSS